MKIIPTAAWALLVAGSLAVASGAARADSKSDKRNAEVEALFKAADKDGDGKLTLSEAKMGMPRIAKAFDKIDSPKKGYLTLEQVKAAAATL